MQQYPKASEGSIDFIAKHPKKFYNLLIAALWKSSLTLIEVCP
ncbi:hypothetical protein [Fervidicoccus fontis]|uniref:Uncharacterized protein n=1 Tax=Fervidicoccus fontis (strain DSM 19380 / JCM 18336 / VKM B-2539 / Kam940) TaxID=1163730 RepID=H9ZZY6_FERFK|nr:hypothetical protein [Fervidicoccus fontis]AFH42293.1 hypothetical protein FFONT_0303 [Fervidicoccus fontis Kam940]